MKENENNFEKEPIEIERKFLVGEIPANLNQYPHVDIEQGYLPPLEVGTEIRLRRAGDKYYKTKKSGGGIARTEEEVEISQEQFQKEWSETEGSRIEKTRYRIPFEENLIELDIYQGRLEGLVVAEIEFESSESAEKFSPPSWLGEEVTENQSYKNKNLAVQGLP